MDRDNQNDCDVDGFDFLKWQRGDSPNPLSASDLDAVFKTVVRTNVPLHRRYESESVNKFRSRFVFVLN